MRTQAPIFEKIYREYLEDVAALDFAAKAEILGIRVEGKTIGIPFYHKVFTITPDGIADSEGKRPHHTVSVTLCKYLLLCPESPPGDRTLVTYKDFRDAAPYVGGFRNTAEKRIAKYFSGRTNALEKRCRDFGGKACDIGINCELSYVFQALPEVPIYLIFNDADEEFPADCTLLFERRAAEYLDMECLAMVGMVLAEWLTANQRG